MVLGERAIPHLLAGNVGRLPYGPKHPLEQPPHGERKVLVQPPDLAQGSPIAALVPDGAGKVPEVHGLAVRDEEGLAVDALRVEGHGGRHAGGGEQGLDGEQVREGDVLDVREVEEVGVVPHLELGLALLVRADHGREQLDVALAEDARGADRAREEGGGRAVRGEDGLLGVGFGRRVVLGLGGARDERPGFGGVDELGFRAEDDGRGGGVDEGFYACGLRRGEEVLGALDVDRVVHGGGEVEVRAGGVDDGVRAQLGEEGGEEGRVGDVGVVVGYERGGEAVGGGAQVEDGDCGLGMAFVEERDDVRAEEAAAADDGDVPEGRDWSGGGRGHGGRGIGGGECGWWVWGSSGEGVGMFCGPRGHRMQGLGSWAGAGVGLLYFLHSPG